MGRHAEIYKTKEWKTTRAAVISKANGLCQECRKKGKIVKGKEVHHIKHLTDNNKDDWNIVYNTDNLTFLCSDCHNDIHDRSIGLQDFLTPPG